MILHLLALPLSLAVPGSHYPSLHHRVNDLKLGGCSVPLCFEATLHSKIWTVNRPSGQDHSRPIIDNKTLQRKNTSPIFISSMLCRISCCNSCSHLPNPCLCFGRGYIMLHHGIFGQFQENKKDKTYLQTFLWYWKKWRLIDHLILKWLIIRWRLWWEDCFILQPASHKAAVNTPMALPLGFYWKNHPSSIATSAASVLGHIWGLCHEIRRQKQIEIERTTLTALHKRNKLEPQNRDGLLNKSPFQRKHFQVPC